MMSHTDPVKAYKLIFLKILVSSFLITCSGSTNNDWWKHASLYQIYPRSFKDSNNDGIGDLKGIIEKMDHFPNSGIDAIWLSPIFRSPQVDQGYDISDYKEVDPDYGTNDDLKQLIDTAHSKGVKVILDFVPNHTSDKHQWFIDSVNGVEEYRDYYVWVNAKFDDDGNRLPPNNWISLFKHSAWTWNEKRQQYYLHQFSSAQPDLNYRNPKVVEAVKDVLKFWLDKDIDGFRIDAVNYLFEDKDLRDEPLSNLSGYTSSDHEYLDHIYTKDQSEDFEMVYEWRTFIDDYTAGKGIIITEAYAEINRIIPYFGTADGKKLGAHFAFNFNLITDLNINSTAHDIVKSITKWLDAIPNIYTSNWVLGNHDRPRVATRLGPKNVDGFNILKSLLPGVAVTYNGEEIGQENGEVSFKEGQDPGAKDPDSFDELSRDFERTPYQWDDSVNAGFNDGAKPWLPVSKKYIETNLKKEQETDPSHYKVYQTLAKIRTDPVLIYGDVKVAAVANDVVLVKRTYNDIVIALIFNKGYKEVTVNVSEDIAIKNVIAITSIDSARRFGLSINPANLKLDAYEALVVRSCNMCK